MVAYSFKAQFAAPILAGTKCQTIRGSRKRHARPGEAVQLFTGLRTKQTKRLGSAQCIAVTPIRLDFASGRIESLDTGNSYTTHNELDAFAVRDGFSSWSHLMGFWKDEHDDPDTWDGVLIRWQGFAAA